MKFSNVSVPRGYEAAFQRAIWTFHHQRVFDPEARRVVHLKPLPPGGLVAETGVTGALPEDDPGLSFLGPLLDDNLAARIAAGKIFLPLLCPTHVPFHLSPSPNEYEYPHWGP